MDSRNENSAKKIHSPTNPASPSTMRFSTAWDSSLTSRTSPRMVTVSRIRLRMGGDAQMPPDGSLQNVENWLGKVAEIPDLDVSVFHIFGDFVREDMSDLDIVNLEVRADELWNLSSRVGIGDRTPGLRLGMPGNQLRHLPEGLPAAGRQHQENPPRQSVIKH